jgi:hypothetical protein
MSWKDLNRCFSWLAGLKPLNPLTVPKGEIREVVKTDANGLKVRHFIGQESFVKQMGRPGRRVVSFRTDQGYVDASRRGLR